MTESNRDSAADLLEEAETRGDTTRHRLHVMRAYIRLERRIAVLETECAYLKSGLEQSLEHNERIHKRLLEKQDTMQALLETLANTLVTNRIDNVSRWEKFSIKALLVIVLTAGVASLFYDSSKLLAIVKGLF